MNEQMKKLEAIKKRCHTASNVLGFIRGFVIVCAVIAIVCGSVMFAYEEKINPELNRGIEEGYLTLDNNVYYSGAFSFMMDLESYFPPENHAAPLGITCFIAGFTCIVITVILTFIRKIFTSLETENTPFSEKCMHQIKVSFIVLFVTSLMSMSLGVTIIVGLILYCIYSIFEYGAALQTEIDETL